MSLTTSHQPPGAGRPQTLAEKILSRKAGRPVKPGELVVVEVDHAMTIDSIVPTVIARLEYLGKDPFDPRRVSLVFDHVAPPANVNVANAQKQGREWARRTGVNFFEVGRGVCHQVLVEEGIAKPGMLIVGSDSHSTTYGALAAFGTGMGATDIALAIATGKTWLKVPESVKVVMKGRPRPGVSAKDAALEMVGRLGADGATYMAVEIHLEDGAEEAFGLSERMTLANLTMEAGAKAGLVVPSGEILERYPVPEWLYPDPNARYAKTLEIDLTELTPRLSVPFYVDNVHPAAAYAGTEVDFVFIGTCTNGRIEDLRAAAEVLKGKRIADGVRMLVVPASSEVLKQAMEEGVLQTLIEAGATIGTPGCGPCMGRHMGVAADGERVVSTANRNFRGRMGSASAEVYLASPRTAALAALTGRIPGEEENP